MIETSYESVIKERKGMLLQVLQQLESVVIEKPEYANGQSIDKQIQIDQFNYEIKDARKMLHLAYESLSHNQ